ncbi:MAG: nucleoside hydrolase [Acidobacteriaceae bacterium]|nr:nucleoside hydrolase [Acidobacteriaceae bacterium]
MSSQRRVLIDTDTASDDAVALIMALRSAEVDVKAITVAAGNVPVDQATSNALYTTELCGSNVPVFRGAAKPLLRTLQIADWFHGKDGLGDHGYAPASYKVEQEHAVSAIGRTIAANPGIEIITLGPLTNLAAAILQQPGIVDSVSRCVVMGGAPCCEGNVTPAAEFNIWVDPEAAHIVFQSGLPIEMVGWQLSRGAAAINHGDVARMLNLDTPFAEFAIRCNSSAEQAFYEQTGEKGICLPDPIAMAVLLQPKLCLESSEHHVKIETTSELTRGMTVVDRLGVAPDQRNRHIWSSSLASRKVRVCWRLDVAGWKAALMTALR